MSSPAVPRHRLRSPRRPLTTPGTQVGTEHPPVSDAERAAALAIEVEQLHAAMVSRACIEQAKGILMLLTGCTDRVAFELLSHMSGCTHRKLRDVARAITESASGGGGLPADLRAVLRDVCPPAAPPG